MRHELRRDLCDQLDLSDFKFPVEARARRLINCDFKHQERLVELVNRASSRILDVTSKFCLIDLFDTIERDKRRASEPLGRRSSATSANGTLALASRPSWRSSSWPKLVYVISIYCLLKLFLNVCRQYAHDRHVVRLNWLTRHPELAGHFESARELQARINETRRELKAVGAPHINGTIAIECVYVTIIMLCLVSYVSGHIYFSLVEKFDFYLARAILDRRREQRNCRQLLLDQANTFIESRRVYANLCLAQCCSFELAQPPPPALSLAPHQLDLHRKLAGRLVLEQRLLIEQFKLMAASGALLPLNRTERWLDLMSFIYCAFNCSCFAWTLVFNAVFYFLLERLGNFTSETDPLDLLFGLELMLISLICSVALIFYLSTTIISCLDQARLISRVHALILNCIRHNARVSAAAAAASSRRQDARVCQPRTCWRATAAAAGAPAPFCALNSGSPQERERLCRHHKRAQLNANLLYTLMHYKIFVVQLRPILKPVGFVTFVSLSMMLLHPIMVRLHTPYVESRELKSRYYIISLITACFVNMNTLPACYINSRCVDLYRALHSLLAHTIELTLNQDERLLALPHLAAAGFKPTSGGGGVRAPPSAEVYDSHSIWSLRRELKSSERFVRQFETRAFGLTFTYGTLLRTYFWVGAIAVSILTEPNNDHANLGSAGGVSAAAALAASGAFLKDPFGFYGFRT